MFVHFRCAREKGDANPIECTAHNKHKCWLTMLHALKKKKRIHTSNLYSRHEHIKNKIRINNSFGPLPTFANNNQSVTAPNRVLFYELYDVAIKQMLRSNIIYIAGVIVCLPGNRQTKKMYLECVI